MQRSEETETGTNGSITATQDFFSFFSIQSESHPDPSYQFLQPSQLHMPAVTSMQQLAALANQMSSGGNNPSTIPLPHAIHSAAFGWVRSKPEASPTHPVTLRVHKASYSKLKLALPAANLKHVPSRPVKDCPVFDSGDQMNITPAKIIQQMGLQSGITFPRFNGHFRRQ